MEGTSSETCRGDNVEGHGSRSHATVEAVAENAPLVGVGQMWTPLLAFSTTSVTLLTRST